MHNKFKLLLLVSLCSLFIHYQPLQVQASTANHQLVQFNKLTEEQKQKLLEKKQELKEKYLKNWEKMTSQEKKTAIDNYKKEMRDFCKELGIPEHSFRDHNGKFPQFKRILP